MQSLTCSWKGTKYPIQLEQDQTISDIKELLCQITLVLPEKQKLLGLVKGKLPLDTTTISSLGLKQGHLFNMMGTAEKDLIVEKVYDVVDDFLVDVEYDSGHDPSQDPSNITLVEKVITQTSIHIIHAISPKKKLLVLDLDYTLFDCKTPVNHLSILIRPGMHEMLTVLADHYEFCIWSQTSWRWLEAKITELGMLTHTEYKISFVLDKKAMPSIIGKVKGKNKRHQVKPLDLIWKKLPFGPHNTIHVDDLSRNFAMNPQSGLKITAFKNAPVSRATDRELVDLTRYLLQLTLVDDFRQLDHKVYLID
jgi:ubiquitin-like domain-containing CTD phosphatase 1